MFVGDKMMFIEIEMMSIKDISMFVGNECMLADDTLMSDSVRPRLGQPRESPGRMG